MNGFGRAYKKVIAEGKISDNKISMAIDRHVLVVIRYNTHGERLAMADRLCGVFAYGVTKAGNPCIRVYEYEGDTTTFVPGWKLIRIDRIIAWHETKRTFDSPPKNTGNGEFNPNGDNSMSIVYKIAKFGEENVETPNGVQPKTNMSAIGKVSKKQYAQKADAETKAKIGLKPYSAETQVNSNEPKTADSVNSEYPGKRRMKTDTETAMDSLRKQLENPEKIDLSKFDKENRTKTQDLSKSQDGQPSDENTDAYSTEYPGKKIRKTDTETAMDYLRRQLENPEKIDLTKVPKR